MAALLLALPAPGSSSAVGGGHPIPLETQGDRAIPAIGPGAAVTGHTGASDPAPSGVVQWPTISFDLQHTAANLQESIVAPSNVSGLRPVWSFPTPGGVTDSLAVVNGTAYFGDWNGTMYAVNASSGALEWRESLGGSADYTGCGEPGIAATATVVNGTVYIGGSNPVEYALNASTGAILWQVDLANYTGASSPWTAYKAWSSALVIGDQLYVGTASGCDQPLVRAALLQVSLASHSIDHLFYTINATDLGNSIWSSPSYDPGTKTVWVSTGNGLSDLEQYSRSIMAFNASNVSELVGYAQEAPPFHDYDFGDGVTIFHSPTGVPMAVALNKDGYAYAFNISSFHGNDSAHPAWATEIASVPSLSYSPPAFNGAMLYFGSANTTLPNGTAVNGSLQAVYPNNGTVKWIVPLPYSVFGGLTYANGLLYAGLTGGFPEPTHGGFVVVNATDGATLFYRAGDASWGEPVVANGEVFVSSGNLSSSGGGAVTAYALPLTGAYAATFVPGHPETTYELRAHPHGGVAPYNDTWSFGDGGMAFGANTTYGFATAGNFSARLVIRDALGDTVEAEFFVNASPPLTVVTRTGVNPFPIGGSSWVSLSTAGAALPYSYNWSGLPPGSTGAGSTSTNVSLHPPTNGEWNVSVLVSSPTGQALDVAFPMVLVNGPPTVSISASPSSGGAPLNVSFSASFPVPNVTATYAWQFGDGVSSSLRAPTHVYPNTGPYQVSLTVLYPGGGQAGATLTVEVQSPSSAGPLELAVALVVGVAAVIAVAWYWRRRGARPVGDG
jgi:outer membrane protein assembly factor BamB/PKD repeat protein